MSKLTEELRRGRYYIGLVASMNETDITRRAADEIDRLNAALSMTREGVEPDEAKRIQNCIT